MTLKDHYKNLDAAGKKRFAKSIGRSPEYVRIHLIPKNHHPDRTPPLSVLKLIPAATSGEVTLSEVIEHFSHAVDAVAA